MTTKTSKATEASAMNQIVTALTKINSLRDIEVILDEAKARRDEILAEGK